MPLDALRERLQTSLGAAYLLTRELGGGGMSRVFVARDAALDRDVVVKVLAPELAAGLSAERFAREIRLAASLQQANIVPVHAAGTFDGPSGALPYYTMPFVEGESLRHRLARGPLPVGEVVAILRDVSRALAYAHARGVVHRDIKPDNVLLSGGAAVVTDFGIAKALGAARTSADPQATETAGTALTGFGAAIGTPAYMAPEQAAADPAADARVDVYAFGCLAYELLAGTPPFAGRSPQRLLVAHLTERPAPVASQRPDTPPALAALVARCLEKEPVARPASATELLRALDAATTPGASAAIPTMLAGGAAAFRRALLVYAAAFVAVAVLAKLAITAIGLPDWVLPGTLVVAALGLPVLLFIGYAQRVVRHAATITPTVTSDGTRTTHHGTVAQLALKASPHLSWRRAARWGAVTLGAFAALVAGFMTLRALGVGPFGTLFAAGAMREGDAVVVADFASPGDSTLGRTIAQGVKTDLRQSRAIRVLDDADVARTLALMQRRDARFTFPVAREVAERAGVPMVVDGTITPAGAGFVVSLRLVTADSGREMASYQRSVNAPGELIDAVGGLTRKLRAHVGESLRDVQRSPKLAEVTTSSIEALRRYTEAYDVVNDGPRFVALLREAIALDSTFARAYVGLTSMLGSPALQDQRGEQERLISRAYALRARLTDFERYAVEALYFDRGPRDVLDTSKVRAALQAAVDDPRNGWRQVNSLGWHYELTHQYAAAESAYRRAIARDTLRTSVPLSNLFRVVLLQGRYAEAESLSAVQRRRFPRSPFGAWQTIDLLTARGATDSTARVIDGMVAAARDPYVRSQAYCLVAGFYDASAGRLARYDSATRGCAAAREATGSRTVAVDMAIDRASVAAVVGDVPRARALLDSLAARGAVAALDSLERPNAMLASTAAIAGDVRMARAALARAEAQMSEQDRNNAFMLRLARAHVAIAERRWDDAIREARLATLGVCQTCNEVVLGMAYEGKGQADSAIAAYERSRMPLDYTRSLAYTLRHLGALYEAKGDLPNAIDRYQRFVTLWQHADPVLQPQVADVRARIARLQAREARAR